MRSTSLFILFAAVLLSLAAHPLVIAQPGNSAEDDKEIKSLQDDAEDFLAGLAIDPAKAYEALLGGGPLADHAEKMLTDTQALKKYGAFPGPARIEHVGTRRIGKDVVLLRCLQKFERMPVAWHFTFYRAEPDGEFALITVRFDTEIELLGLAVGDE
jgi:hypothetical protein